MDTGIKHEYHIVHGGDHGGRTMLERTTAALEFLGHVVNPLAPDAEMRKFRQMVAPAKQKLGISDELK